MKKDALLLIGPTGSGKSPLGDRLAQVGIGGRTCRHFDFGARLRNAQAGTDYGLNPDEQLVVQNVLTQGALLEPLQFGIALKILTHFLAEDRSDPPSLTLLNGLPRHVQQAEGIQQQLEVRGVVVLRCSADVVCERIRLDSGGDRAGRNDDDLSLIRQKLETFTGRTEPLIDYYRTKGVNLCEVNVSVHAPPDEMIKTMAQDFSIWRLK